MKDIKKYLYVINYPIYEEELCFMEMRTLFGKEPEAKVLISQRDFEPSNSVFIKRRLEVIYEAESLEGILEQLKVNEMHLEGFKVEYLRLDTGNISYDERLKSAWEIGQRIVGQPSMKSPKIMLGVTRYQGKWFFGISESNDFKWQLHENKPCSYSNSFGVRTARAMVNMASMGYPETRVIDPCCGVGTTLVEGLSMGYDIWGSEINKKIADNANENLRHYGFGLEVENRDMHGIEENYDASIIDIPYGLFSHTSEEEQQEIINTARRISKKMVMVTFENLDKLVHNAGFEIVDRCTVNKGTFKRYILVCE